MADRKDWTGGGEEGIRQQENRMVDHSTDQKPDRKVPSDHNDFEDDPVDRHYSPEQKLEQAVLRTDYSSEDKQDSSMDRNPLRNDDWNNLYKPTVYDPFAYDPYANGPYDMYKKSHDQMFQDPPRIHIMEPIEIPKIQIPDPVDLHGTGTADPMVLVYIVGAAVLGGVMFGLSNILWRSCIESKSNYRATIARARASNTSGPRNEVSHITPTRPPVASNDDYVAVNITPDRTEFNSCPHLPNLAAKDNLPPSYITCLLEEDHPPPYSTAMLGDSGDSCGVPDSPGVHGTSEAS